MAVKSGVISFWLNGLVQANWFNGLVQANWLNGGPSQLKWKVELELDKIWLQAMCSTY